MLGPDEKDYDAVMSEEDGSYMADSRNPLDLSATAYNEPVGRGVSYSAVFSIRAHQY